MTAAVDAVIAQLKTTALTAKEMMELAARVKAGELRPTPAQGVWGVFTGDPDPVSTPPDPGESFTISHWSGANKPNLAVTFDHTPNDGRAIIIVTGVAPFRVALNGTVVHNQTVTAAKAAAKELGEQ